MLQLDALTQKTNRFFNAFNEKIHFIKKPFLFLTLIYSVGIMSILRANFNYIDDTGRILKGYKTWENFSRYLTNFFSTFIHGDNYLTDVSPLPQILCVLLLSITGVFLIYLISGKKDFSIWQLIALVPLGLSPYFLQCISYKYDAPYMGLSILASIAPILFYKRDKVVFCIATFIGILVMCTTYQASSGIFPMLVILLAMKSWHEKSSLKEIGKWIGLSAGSYVAGMVVFMLFIMQPANEYVSNSTPPIMQMPLTFVSNLKEYYTYIFTDFKDFWLVFVILLLLAFLFVATRDSKQKKIPAFLISFFALILMLILPFGFYPALENPLFEPRAMYGFGVLLAFLGVYVVSAVQILPGKIICLVLSWVFFVFSFTYGNALYEQKVYTDFQINTVVEELNDMPVFTTNEMKYIQIDGSIGQSPVLRNMPQDYQMLNRLVPITFGGRWYWSNYKLFYYYKIPNISIDDSINLADYNMPVVKDAIYYTIQQDGNYILITLK